MNSQGRILICFAIIAAWTNPLWGQASASSSIPETKQAESVNFNGYANAGVLCNTYGAQWNGNVNGAGQSGGGFNAAYLAVLKQADTTNQSWDWGFEADFLFGEDARVFRSESGLDHNWITGHNAAGEPTYGFALPQLFGDIAYDDWNVRLGHFYTPIGFESMRADERFFYSVGPSYDMEPGTHTGVLLSCNKFQRLEITVGWVAGLNQSFDNTQDASLFSGLFKYKITEKLSLRYSLLAGNFNQQYTENGQRTCLHGIMNSWAIEWTSNDRWTLATTADYFDRQSTFAWYNTNFGQHVYYKVNEDWSAGLRAEWVQTIIAGQRNDWTSLTWGLHWSPQGKDSILIRPEIRYDHNRDAGYGRQFNRKDQLCLGGDLLLKY